eukprot:scaffold87818_cov36-Tisochrysis_lutea.AAC.5
MHTCRIESEDKRPTKARRKTFKRLRRLLVDPDVELLCKYNETQGDDELTDLHEALLSEISIYDRERGEIGRRSGMCAGSRVMILMTVQQYRRTIVQYGAPGLKAEVGCSGFKNQRKPSKRVRVGGLEAPRRDASID